MRSARQNVETMSGLQFRDWRYLGYVWGVCGEEGAAPQCGTSPGRTARQHHDERVNSWSRRRKLQSIELFRGKIHLFSQSCRNRYLVALVEGEPTSIRLYHHLCHCALHVGKKSSLEAKQNSCQGYQNRWHLSNSYHGPDSLPI
jgi:hypothetical protein